MPDLGRCEHTAALLCAYWKHLLHASLLPSPSLPPPLHWALCLPFSFSLCTCRSCSPTSPCLCWPWSLFHSCIGQGWLLWSSAPTSPPPRGLPGSPSPKQHLSPMTVSQPQAPQYQQSLSGGSLATHISPLECVLQRAGAHDKAWKAAGAK